MILTVIIHYDQPRTYEDASYTVDNGDLSIHRGENMIAYFPRGNWTYVEGDPDAVPSDQDPQS